MNNESLELAESHIKDLIKIKLSLHPDSRMCAIDNVRQTYDCLPCLVDVQFGRFDGACWKLTAYNGKNDRALYERIKNAT